MGDSDLGKKCETRFNSRMYSLTFGKIEVYFYLVVKPSADVTAEKSEETNDLTLNTPGNRKRRIERPKVAEKSHPSIHPPQSR